MKKTVLIFGVGGFVGHYLAQEFYNNGYTVFGSDVKKAGFVPPFVSYQPCDLLDSDGIAKLITEIKPSHIVNLAAISSVGLSWKIPQKVIAVNVEGTLNILEAARKCEELPKILLIGSSEEYAISTEPINEQSEINANNPYGISKIMQEKFSIVYRERYGMKIFHVRPFNHTGVGQADSFVIPSWCKQAAIVSKSGQPGTMRVGNLNVKRDFSNVKDIVRAYRMVIESNDCEVFYNIGSGHAFDLRVLLAEIISLSEQPITVVTDEDLFRPVDNPVICCDNSLIRDRLGWNPAYDLKKTIKELFDFYLQNADSKSEKRK